MKFEQIADSIVEIFNSYNFEYKMYSENKGTRTSNPYEARYFYVSSPNIMIILERDQNVLMIHKSGIPFQQFKPILQKIRNIGKRFFTNIEVKDYNSNFKPKDFSSDLLKKRYTSFNSMVESIQHEQSEVYEKNGFKILVDKNRKDYSIVYNGNEKILLNKESESLIPYIVEHIFLMSTISSKTINTLSKALHESVLIKSKGNAGIPLSINEKKLLLDIAKIV